MTTLNHDRRSFVTASEGGGFLALSPYFSAKQAIDRKRDTGYAVPENDAMTTGKALEPLLLRLWNEGEMGLAPEHPAIAWPQDKIVTNPCYPWGSCTPDALVGGRYPVDFKATSQDISDLAANPSWHLQVVLQAMLLDQPHGELAVFSVSRELQYAIASQVRLGASLASLEGFLCDYLRKGLRRFPVPVSAQLAACLDRVFSDFHRRFIAGNEPAESWDPPTREVLDCLYPLSDGTVRELTEEEERDVIDLLAMRKTLSDLTARAEGLREKVIGHLKGSTRGKLSGDRSFSYSKIFKRGFVTERAAHYEYRLNLPRSPKGD